MKDKSWYFGVLVVAIAAIFTIQPLFIPGFFPMHDDTQPARIFEMANALRDGMFPVRWSGSLGYGYGYPIFNYYGPFAYYFGGFVSLLGFDALTATKISMIFAMVFAGFTMYFLARAYWGEYGGIISAVLYLFAPYHALNLYVRGDLAELFAYAFLPLIFLAIYKIHQLFEEKITKKNFINRWFLIGSIGYAGVITSHNLTALMITPILVLYLLVLGLNKINKEKSREKTVTFQSKLYKQWQKYRVLLYMGTPLFIGILLSGFYWLPALSEMKYSNVLSQIGGKADFRLHYVCPDQLWESLWGFGGSVPGCIDGMSFRIGKIHLILTILSSILIIYFKNKLKSFLPLLLIIGFFLISIWLTTSSSEFVWKIIPFMDYFQFPWRFLLTISFFSSFLGGSIIWIISENFKKLSKIKYFKLFLTMIFVVLIVFHYEKLFNPQTILPKDANNYISEESLKWNISKISDEYMPINFLVPKSSTDIVKNKIEFLDGFGEILSEKNKTHNFNAILDVHDKPAQILLKTAYFPSWQLYLDNNLYKYEISNKGLIVNIPDGRHEIELKFKQTRIQLFANFLSLYGIFILGLGIINILPGGDVLLTPLKFLNKKHNEL